MSSGPEIYPFFKGRVALHAILKAAGIGEGDQVLMPGYTCVVVPNAVNFSGATPIFIDIDPGTYNLDLDLLDQTRGTLWDPARTRAIIVQHTYGIPCDMERVGTFARENGLLVIEDSCHALGSNWNGSPVGTQGDAAFFSSQWSKPITTGLGGWAQVNNPELKKALAGILSQYQPPRHPEALLLETQYLAFAALNHPQLFWLIQGLYRTLGSLGLAIGSSSATELACEMPMDFQKGMHPLQQRRLRKLLNDLEGMIQQRRDSASALAAALEGVGLPGVKVPARCDPVFLRYPLLVKNKQAVLSAAKTARVQLGDWFLSPIHPNDSNWELAGYEPGCCPLAERICNHVINIPTGPGLTEREISRTVDFLADRAEFMTAADLR